MPFAYIWIFERSHPVPSLVLGNRHSFNSVEESLSTVRAGTTSMPPPTE